MEETFTEIWLNGSWIPPGGVATRSGCGSSLSYTENLRRTLPALAQRHSIRSIIDAPCGDFNWMPLVAFPNDLTYVGCDVVKPLIDELSLAHPHRQFRHLDLTVDPLPDSDLLFCRDCLIHFSYHDINLALRNFLSSRIEYILTTSYSDVENTDIETGGFRPLNLEQAPFFFGQPLDGIDDWIEGWPPRRMLLWRREDLRMSIQRFAENCSL